LAEEAYTLTDTGYLKPGFYNITLDQLGQYFAENIPDHKIRRFLYDGFCKMIEFFRLMQITDCVLWIGGSFVSSKEHPGDIDVVCFIDYNVLKNMSRQHQDQLFSLDMHASVKRCFHCDLYFVATYPEDSPEHAIQINKTMYWRGVWGFDRKSVPRGILQLTIGRGCEGWTI